MLYLKSILLNAGELHRLTCGSVPNGTEWDSLEGIAKRKEHPNSPEPEVAIIFRQPDSQSTEVDIEELAERLYRAKLEVLHTLIITLLAFCYSLYMIFPRD